MAQKTLAQTLGDFVYDLSYSDLPPEIVEKAEISVADGIACALAGCDLPSSRIARKIWKELKKEGRSTAWVNGEKGDSQYTAWLNCLLMHSILHDDMQESTVGHMGSFVIPAALAVAEEERKGGKDLLTAVAARLRSTGENRPEIRAAHRQTGVPGQPGLRPLCSGGGGREIDGAEPGADPTRDRLRREFLLRPPGSGEYGLHGMAIPERRRFAQRAHGGCAG